MILGTDISHWEDDPTTPKEINFNMMKEAGAWFTIFKATQAKYTDRVFQISWPDAKGILPRGAYCYLDYSIPGLEQAKYFVDTVYGKGDDPEIPPIVDFECRVNVPPNANAHLWNWLTYVESQVKRIPIIYTGPYYWKEFGSKNQGWSKYPLWIANYKVPNPYVPAPWSIWTFWQFTDRGPGGVYGAEAKGIDLDYFNGSYEDLLNMCHIQQPPSEPTHDEKVEILWRDAGDAGWDMSK